MDLWEELRKISIEDWGKDDLMSENASAVGHKPEGLRVLLVDDDRNLLETTAVLLEDVGTLLKARDGASALSLLAQHEIHVLCSDYQMPGMDGIELLRTAHQRDPRLIGILMTGYCERLPPGVADDPAVFALLSKPYTLDTLRKTIREAARCATMARLGAHPKFTARALP